MAIIEAKNLTKQYGDFTAVDGINFKVKEGEILGFLGPNGAGKTSTINMLTGLSRITSGNIRIKGVDTGREMKKVQQLIGVVPGESNLYPELSGFENLCFCASLYGVKKKDRKSTRLNSSHVRISYAVFCLKKKNKPCALQQIRGR